MKNEKEMSVTMTYNYKEIVPYLLQWYDYNARILPWRENPSAYYIWVSEIMLQQTRVEAVKGYFDRFIKALPDIKSLAQVPEELLLKLWEGLGYYNRVRNLQKAAIIIMDKYEGVLPSDYETLLTLPGIGTYTAGAIASTAYQISVPAIDGNVLRVTKRMAGSFDDITKEAVKKQLWQDLLQIMPKDRPGDFNQSLMELGATICLPNGKPLCEQCPVMHLCKAYREGQVMQIPVKPPKKERRREDKTILVFEYIKRYALAKREKKGLLAGLWELPSVEGLISQIELEARLQEQDIKVSKIDRLPAAKHIFTHVEWHMIGYYIKLNEDITKKNGYDQCQLVSEEEMKERHSIPNAFSVYTKEIYRRSEERLSSSDIECGNLIL